ncbi:MAG: preprotein translocase subunit YajC [Crocinitomicaceae bacterium]|nr:preprotein translocase subunit YajC [Crocinitomicaceae bacterium]|tara:strand:+ start:6884 stop:7189 length:306 start_codon:yes stop_codon:yes gene_type:complete
MLNILLQAEATEPGFPWILFLGMFIIMYFFMIRPQMKRQREAKEFREAISKGDTVVTIGGVHGKIISISDLTVVLEVESGKIRVSKSAISPTGYPMSDEVK